MFSFNFITAKRAKKVGIIGKYDTHYGAFLRNTVGKMKITQYIKYTCTFCDKDTVKRTTTGIWECKSCKNIIAGNAFNISTTVAATTCSTICHFCEFASI